tara:strand:+ start:16 stop:321 length:306 start_codon:yes stop_codon:yes gene_type:complete
MLEKMGLGIQIGLVENIINNVGENIMLKDKIWHRWVGEVIEVGEQIHSSGLLNQLVAYCESKNQTTLYLPKQSSISHYFKFSGKFEEVGMLDGKKLWERIK